MRGASVPEAPPRPRPVNSLGTFDRTLNRQTSISLTERTLMKRKIIVFIVAAAPSAIALIAAGFVSFPSGSPYSPGPDGSAATVSARMAPPARPGRHRELTAGSHRPRQQGPQTTCSRRLEIVEPAGQARTSPSMGSLPQLGRDWNQNSF
jgi:hypothetical protein